MVEKSSRRPLETMSRDERGFTLIEVLVSMMITVIVMAAVFGLLTTGQRTFQREPEVADLQQSARMALDMVTRDALQAGAGLPPEFPAFTTKTMDPTVGDQNPDVIEIVGAMQSPGGLPADPEVVADFDGTNVTLQAPVTSLQENDLVVLYNDNPNDPKWIMARVASVTQAGMGGNAVVELDTGSIDPRYTRNTPAAPTWVDARIVRVNVVRYFAQLAPSDESRSSVPPLVLMRQVDFGPPRPVGYLDDFQVSYWVGNVAPVEQPDPPDPTVPVTETSLVSGVRIMVTGRSAQENLEGATTGASGNLIRKTFSSNVNPRNILAGLAARTGGMGMN